MRGQAPDHLLLGVHQPEPQPLCLDALRARAPRRQCGAAEDAREHVHAAQGGPHPEELLRHAAPALLTSHSMSAFRLRRDTGASKPGEQRLPSCAPNNQTRLTARSSSYTLHHLVALIEGKVTQSVLLRLDSGSLFPALQGSCRRLPPIGQPELAALLKTHFWDEADTRYG